MLLRVILVVSLAATACCQTLNLSVGEECNQQSGATGVCRRITECDHIRNDINRRVIPTICSFDRNDAVVCCVDSGALPPPAITARTRIPRTTTTSEAPVRSLTRQTCDVHTPTGRKAYDKCWEYQQRLVKPCQPSPLPNGGMVRVNHCNWKAEDLITGGKDAYEGEFAHMVLLGYGTPAVHWICGGVLVSERFVLTAGHCTVARALGKVQKIKVGILDRDQPAGEDQVYGVLTIIKHPGYKAPHKYNDIALLKTDREITLSRYVVPACLHDGSSVESTAVVTGWGSTVFRRKVLAHVLQKATVTMFEDKICSGRYGISRHMSSGYNSTTQMCYGDMKSNQDSCEGDSGGPLQVKHAEVHCMYNVIGIISFGKWCGFTGEPGIYTRVAPYLPWIESTVWPDQ
ncbi:venom protease-like [Leptidea sinapis]|uniref:venom protease-like n=1 Tax=Leptidea sinapis TaxID=189913 RepID=UPI00212F4717|nr:venom protease-like [Leptidea sinapis]